MTSRQDAKLRFIQEAQSASILDHKNICTIYEIDEMADGLIYIVMPFYDGAVENIALVKDGTLFFTAALPEEFCDRISFLRLGFAHISGWPRYWKMRNNHKSEPCTTAD